MNDNESKLMSEQKDRIEEFKRWTGLGWKDLSAKIGFKSTQNFTDMRTGRYRITPRVAEMIVAAYPEISREWLTFGTGDMLKARPQNAPESKIPFYAGYNRCGYVSPGTLFGQVDAALKVLDPAMNEYPKGGIAMLRRMPEGESPNPGGIYAVRSNGIFIIRMVRPSETGMTLFPSRLDTMPDGSLIYSQIFVSYSDTPEVYEVVGYAMMAEGMYGITY